MKSILLCGLTAIALSIGSVMAKPTPPDLGGHTTLKTKPPFKLPIPPVCLSCPPFDKGKIKEKIIDPKVINPKLDKIKPQGIR